MALVLDTGPVVAALDADDPDHERCAELLASGDDFVLIPTVLVEVEHFLRKRGGDRAWTGLVEDIAAGGYRLEALTLPDLVRAAELQTIYADLGLGLVDASVIAVCERLDERRVATLDRRHFTVVRPRHGPHLALLPA